MSLRFPIVLLMCLTITGICRAEEAPAPDPGEVLAARQVSEELSAMAEQTLHNSKDKAAAKAAMPQCIALWRAAARMTPTEPRFARTLADALMETNDTPGAMEALAAYRALMKYDDHVAEAQYIELVLSQMDGADAKLKYLRGLLDKPAIAMEVRSFCAARGAALLFEKSQNADALDLAQQALTLNALNSEAQQLQFKLTPGAPPVQRMQQLLAMLRANPAQPLVATQLGQICADAGLIQPALGWFTYANSLFNAMGMVPPDDFGRSTASELFVGDQPDPALGVAIQYLTAYPADDALHCIRLAVCNWELSRNKDDSKVQKDTDDAKQTALVALTNQLATVRNKIAGDIAATTRPADFKDVVPMPDLSGDVARLKKSDNVQLGQDYVAAVQSLAWFNIYYRRDVPDADPLLHVMGDLVGDEDVTLTRLRGWRDLVEGDKPAATQKLSAVADRDPYAALGLILLDVPADKAPLPPSVLARANQLLSGHPTGEVGAVLYGALRPLGAQIEPTGPAHDLTTAMTAFPQRFLDILKTPSSPSTFYVLSANVASSELSFNQPLLCTVTIQNISQWDLTVGPDGIIRRDLWFDAQLRGLQQQTVPGAAFDEIGQRFVLKAGQAMSTVVRLDDQKMYPIFISNPGVDLKMNWTVLTNPVQVTAAGADQPAQGRPGLGGYRVSLPSMIHRKPVLIPNQQALTQVFDALSNAAPDERMRLLEALTTYVTALRGDSQLSAEAKGVVEQMAARVEHTVTSDNSPMVRIWARYQAAQTATPEVGADHVMQLVTDADWRARFIGLLLSAGLSDKGKSVAGKLTSDPDASVKEMANLVVQGLTPTTQPTTRLTAQPATRPATRTSY